MLVVRAADTSLNRKAPCPEAAYSLHTDNTLDIRPETRSLKELVLMQASAGKPHSKTQHAAIITPYSEESLDIDVIELLQVLASAAAFTTQEAAR